MDRRRGLMMFFAVVGILLFIWIQFFEVPSKVTISEEKLQQHPETHRFETVVPFESLFMGDASNINGLFEALPLSEYKGTVELESEAHKLIVNYQTPVSEIEIRGKQAVIYNATAAFTLISNLETVDMRFEDVSYEVTRDNVEKWFGTTLVGLREPEVFSEKVQKKLNEDLEGWLAVYTKGYE